MPEPTAAHRAVLAATTTCPLIIAATARAAHRDAVHREEHLRDAAELARALLVRIEIAQLQVKRELETAAALAQTRTMRTG